MLIQTITEQLLKTDNLILMDQSYPIDRRAISFLFRRYRCNGYKNHDIISQAY